MSECVEFTYVSYKTKCKGKVKNSKTFDVCRSKEKNWK